MIDPNIETLYKKARALRQAQKNYIADGTRNEILGNEVRLRGEELDVWLDRIQREGYVGAGEASVPKVTF